MSTTPPPPQPFGYAQTSVPGSLNAKQQKILQAAAFRAQRRATAEQARLQRLQFRQQMHAARRTSLVGPLLLLSLGVVLLLLETGRVHWSDAFTWLGRWWPAILIVAGLIMLAEWALDQRRGTAGIAVIPRRNLGGGTVSLLVLLALLGAGIMAAENGSIWARHNIDHRFFRNGLADLPAVLGQRSETTAVMVASLAPAGTLTVDDPHGDISVTGSSTDGQVHVTLHQHIYAWQGNELDNRRQSEGVHFSGGPSHLLLTAPTEDQDDTDLSIELPHDAPLIIHSNHGDVTLEELRGAVDVRAAGGDVKLTALSGPVHLSTQDDDADITAHSLGAGFTLEGRSGDITLSDIEGPVTLHGDFFGTTHLERVHGAVHFQSSFTDFACAGIPGELNVEGRSDLDVNRVEGPLTLSTTNRNLSLQAVHGAAVVTDRNGSVSLAFAGPLQSSQVNNENGSVEVTIPANQGFGLQANSHNGDIQDDFGLSSQKTGESTQVSGHVGAGGPELRLQTTEGDISLHRAGNDEADSSWSDSPKRITPNPRSQPKANHSTTKPADAQ